MNKRRLFDTKRKRAFGFSSLVIFLVLIIFIASLKENLYFGSLVGYGHPVCKDDKSIFISDRCSKCGATIQENGVFYRKSNVLDNIDFENFYLDYQSFYGNVSEARMLSFATVVGLLMLGIFLFLMVSDKSEDVDKR